MSPKRDAKELWQSRKHALRKKRMPACLFACSEAAYPLSSLMPETIPAPKVEHMIHVIFTESELKTLNKLIRAKSLLQMQFFTQPKHIRDAIERPFPTTEEIKALVDNVNYAIQG